MVAADDGVPRLDCSGRLFLDSNPRTFEVVLDFLRDGAAALPGTQFELSKLWLDARKFQARAEGVLACDWDALACRCALRAFLEAGRQAGRLLGGSGALGWQSSLTEAVLLSRLRLTTISHASATAPDRTCGRN